MKLRLFAVLACAYLLGASREQPWGDANVVYSTAMSLVEQGRLDVQLGGPPQFYALRAGKKYGVFPLGNVVAHVPSYLAFKVVHLLPHGPAIDPLLSRLCSHLSAALMMAGVLVLLLGMLEREGASPATALWLALMGGGATILAVYARVPYGEAAQTLALTWTVERAFAVAERPTARGGLWLGLACGALLSTKLVYALCLPVVPLYVALHNWRYPRLRPALSAVLASGVTLLPLVALALWHNHLKTGSWLDSGYRIPGGVFSGDAYAALFGFFLSTGKSVFLYSPPLFLSALALPSYWRSHRSHARFLIALSAVVVLVNARFRYWHADYCWGPRLLVPLTAVWLLPLAPWIEGALARGRLRLRSAAVGLVVGAGLMVQVLGASLYWDHYIRVAIAVKDQTGASGWYTEDLHHCHFIPQFSPLVGHAWLLSHLLRRDPDLMADAPWLRVVPGRVNLGAEWAVTRLDWWVDDWWHTPGARGWTAAVLLLMLGVGGSAALGLRRGSGPWRPAAASSPPSPEPAALSASGPSDG